MGDLTESGAWKSFSHDCGSWLLGFAPVRPKEYN